MHRSEDQTTGLGGQPEAAKAFALHGPRVAWRLARIEQSTPTRDDVVRRAQRGDAGARRQLYEDHFPAVYAYLLEVLKHHQDAEDASQHVFLKVFASLATYRLDGEPFRNWLFTLVRNHAIDRLRSAGRTRTTVTDPHELDRARDTAATRDDLGSHTPQFVAAVEALPRLQRQVLSLLYVHDLPAAQAAAVLRRTPSAVRQLHRRALRALAAAS